MTSKLKLLGVTALLLASTVLSSGVVQAADWTAREAELVGLHQLCDKGDRKACVRFGMLLGEAKERSRRLAQRPRRMVVVGALMEHYIENVQGPGRGPCCV